ncbi:MAG TPA: nuclear transport factor 2 family protein [Anaerolineae bacterium]
MGEKEIWDTLHRHLASVFTRDSATYAETTSRELSLYEWWVVPHRQDGLDFHLFMIENAWAGESEHWRYDLLEPRLQIYDDVAIVSYTLMVSRVTENGITHRAHNESRVLIKRDDRWQVVHVHKSPAWSAPYQPSAE